MGLNIGIGCVEQFFCPVDGQFFGDVDVFTPAIIAFIRITLCIFVGENTCLGSHHSRTGNILRGNKFQGVFLPVNLHGNCIGNFRINTFDYFKTQRSPPVVMLMPTKNSSPGNRLLSTACFRLRSKGETLRRIDWRFCIASSSLPESVVAG